MQFRHYPLRETLRADLVVVGSGPAGLAALAAAFEARPGLNAIAVDRRGLEPAQAPRSWASVPIRHDAAMPSEGSAEDSDRETVELGLALCRRVGRQASVSWQDVRTALERTLAARYPRRMARQRAVALVPALDSPEAAGVLLLDVEDGTLRLVQAKTIVVATGAGCGMFPSWAPAGDAEAPCCDGLAMLLRFGIRLAGLQQVAIAAGTLAAPLPRPLRLLGGAVCDVDGRSSAPNVFVAGDDRACAPEIACDPDRSLAFALGSGTAAGRAAAREFGRFGVPPDRDRLAALVDSSVRPLRRPRGGVADARAALEDAMLAWLRGETARAVVALSAVAASLDTLGLDDIAPLFARAWQARLDLESLLTVSLAMAAAPCRLVPTADVAGACAPW